MKKRAPLCYNFINLAVDAPGVSKAVFTTVSISMSQDAGLLNARWGGLLVYGKSGFDQVSGRFC